MDISTLEARISANIAQQQANFERQDSLLAEIHKELGAAGRTRASPATGRWEFAAGRESSGFPGRDTVGGWMGWDGVGGWVGWVGGWRGGWVDGWMGRWMDG